MMNTQSKRLARLRICLMTLFLISAAGSVQAQNSQPPELQVIRFSWSKFRLGSLRTDTGMSAADRNSPDTSRVDAKLDVLRDNKDVSEKLKTERQEMLQKERAKIHSNQNPEPGNSYRYSLEARNTSPKQVDEIQWDYVFIDPRTQQEALRYHFASRTKIKPGKSAKLTIYSAATPYLVVDANKPSQQDGERVVIKRIVYADGSVWEVR